MQKMPLHGDPKSLARKPRTTAESLGQIFTGHDLACRIVAGLGITPDCPAKLLDPCVGPATFPKALTEKQVGLGLTIDAFDVDPHMVNVTTNWAQGHKRVRVQEADYLQVQLDKQYDFAILNPPYVRQEWIELKQLYRNLFRNRYGLEVPGTANLYVYFVAKVLADLKAGGRMACIVYDSWQSTRYGQWLQTQLEKSCVDIDIEPVSSVPFEGRMIDATIINATKREGSSNTNVTRVRRIESDNYTAKISGLNEISTLFHSKRGLRLKQADFFLSHINKQEIDGGRPFNKKVGLVAGFQVPDEHPESVLLITKDSEDFRTRLELEKRLSIAESSPDKNVSILTWHKERPSIWARHRDAPWAPILFNYYLRNRPKHILNPNRIYSDNFYGLTPSKPGTLYAWLAAMNSTLSAIGIIEKARNQGAGLAKLQLFEYRSARVVDISNWQKDDLRKMESLGESLALGMGLLPLLITEIDDLIAKVYGNAKLKPTSLEEVLRDVDCRARRPRKSNQILAGTGNKIAVA